MLGRCFLGKETSTEINFLFKKARLGELFGGGFKQKKKKGKLMFGGALISIPQPCAVQHGSLCPGLATYTSLNKLKLNTIKHSISQSH